MASKYMHQKAFRASTVKTALRFVDPKTQDIILTKFDSLMEENRNAVLRKVLPGFLSKTYDNRLWNFSWKQNDKDSVRVDAASCPYFETCVHYGVPELGAIFCEGDDKSFGNMKHVGWGRTKTLAKGGDLCDFCFYKR